MKLEGGEVLKKKCGNVHSNYNIPVAKTGNIVRRYPFFFVLHTGTQMNPKQNIGSDNNSVLNQTTKQFTT